MLVGSLNQPKSFSSFLRQPAWQSALNWLREHELELPHDGTYSVTSDGIKALVQTIPPSKPPNEQLFEAHRLFVDVQCVFSGDERIGFAHTASLTVHTPYDAANDVTLYEVPHHYSSIFLPKDAFAIFLPEDGHLPGLTGTGTRKVVIKIPVNLVLPTIL